MSYDYTTSKQALGRAISAGVRDAAFKVGTSKVDLWTAFEVQALSHSLPAQMSVAEAEQALGKLEQLRIRGEAALQARRDGSW